MFKKNTYVLFLMMMGLLLLAACGDDNNASSNTNDVANANNTNDNQTNDDVTKEDKLYFEFGETFELEGYYSKEPMNITINDVWLESVEDHEEYVEEIYGDSEVFDVVMIDMTVENKGESDIAYGDFIPKYTGMNTEFDVTYPENDKVSQDEDPYNAVLEPGEETQFVGSVITIEPYLEFSSAIMFNGYQAEDELVVFAVPQEDQKTPIGTYGLDESIYPVNYGEDGGVEIVLHDVNFEEKVDGLEHEGDVTYIAYDVTITNESDERVELDSVMPYNYVDEEVENVILDVEGRASHIVTEDGKEFKSYDESIEPKETIKGTIYS